MIKTDYLVIGSGIAALSFALKAAKNGKVALITKRELPDSCTVRAQGGVACVSDPDDSFERHIEDTITAGAGLCRRDIVEKVIKEGPARIEELIALGVKFSTKSYQSSEFELGLEGGHSMRRILHSGDITGAEIERVLANNAQKNKNITIYEHHAALDLITENGKCVGAYVFNSCQNKIEIFAARITVLATGGAGKVYLYTSNPDVITGDGVAMAYRAGGQIENMEFVQFHPTCLYNPVAKSFLISEAVRGEGGILKLKNGQPFMQHYHPLKELAPRDIVARAIDKELKTSGDSFVYLDITHKSREFLIKRFPNIYAKCLEFGMDMSKDMIPVVPAAHYFCGGVKTDEYGRTNISNLLAIGEAASTGLHGANRLASNSLLEALVFAHRAFEAARDIPKEMPSGDFAKWQHNADNYNKRSTSFVQDWHDIRRIMWDYVGIVRSDERLQKAYKRIALVRAEIKEYFGASKLNTDMIELRNIADIAEIVILSALKRKESRGLHYNTDYPKTSDKVQNTLVTKN
ncbi:MAG: L-aspartate oxidase [Elusimicrobia bacterium]|nr:L-aspartate oxidase [Elusimicrobiota bacterium]